MNTPTLARRVAALATLALVAGVAAGCAFLPSTNATDEAVPAIDITQSGVQERDVLVAAIQGAAAIAGGQVEPSKDFAMPCDTGEGTMFWYQAIVDDNGDPGQTLRRIDAHWEDLGIATVAKDEEVGHWVQVRDPGTGPIGDGSAAYMDNMPGQSPYYMISGFSNCVQGEPTDYFHLTGQTFVPGVAP